MRASLARLVLTMTLLPLVSAPAAAQQIDSGRVTLPDSLRPGAYHRDARTAWDVAGLSAVGAATFAVAAGGTGMVVDGEYCERHHGDEPGALFGPCFLHTGAATPVGWFSGAVAGGAFGASRVARVRGCPMRRSILRSLAGALLGAAPGALIVASRPESYPPSRSMLIGGAPLLAAVGATLAVRGCHR